MSRLPLRTQEDAPEAARPALEAVQAGQGFVPNLLRVLANAPVALEAYQILSGINARGGLTLAEREVVQILAAATHGCGFCVAGHTAIGTRKAGFDAGTLENLRALRNPTDPRLAAVADLTREVIATRGQVSDAVLEAFRGAGFSDANALEVVLGVSLATLCNFANNLGHPPLNPELEAFRWDPQAVR